MLGVIRLDQWGDDEQGSMGKLTGKQKTGRKTKTK